MNKRTYLLKYSVGFACCLSMLFGQLAYAQGPEIDFAGFASIVYAKTITDDNKEGELGNITDEGEYRDFNKLGLRVSSYMDDNLSFTAQL